MYNSYDITSWYDLLLTKFIKNINKLPYKIIITRTTKNEKPRKLNSSMGLKGLIYVWLA